MSRQLHTEYHRTNLGSLFVPQSPEQFSYDADGNLTNDGRWAYTWDAENRLIGMTVNTNVGPQYQLTFAYDAKGRRIQKMVATNGVALSTNNFLYDGWNLIAETMPDNTRIRTYVWGSDLSGSMQGASGVGGLLEVSCYGSATTNCFPAFDGNGNVAALINAADGTVAANYEYAAFGEPVRATGVMARNNPFRFSTKYADDESDLLYYGYRHYKPSTGTWPNRDPKGENGGLNLYVNVGNNEISQVDPDGRGFVDCAKALSDLGAAEANLAKRLAEAAADVNGTGLDAPHRKSLQQAMNQVENALEKVVKHCGCVVGAAALIAGAIALLDAAAALLAGLVIAA